MDGKITLYCCDIFKFSQNLEDKFQGVWDRASLYAINKSDRRRYVEILRNLCVDDCVYLVETVEKPLLNRLRNHDPPHHITGKWPYGMCYAKKSLMSWAVVIPKEGWTGYVHPSFGVKPTWKKKLKKFPQKNFKQKNLKSQCHTKRRMDGLWQRFRKLGTFSCDVDH